VALYIAIQKSYAGKKPLTRCRATEEGRAALAEYVKSLKRLLGKKLTKTIS
jgi:hypothetical protein